VFGVALTEELSEESLRKVANESLFASLPRVDTEWEETFSVDLKSAQAEPRFQRGALKVLSKVERKRFSPSGELEWVLVVRRDSISAICFEYTRWRHVKPEAMQLLEEAFKALVPPRLKLGSLVCNIVDEFWWVNGDQPVGASLINRASDYVSAQAIRDQEALFHSYCGWYEDTSEREKRLVRTHIDALPASGMQSRPEGRFGVRIDNFIQTFLPPRISGSESDFMDRVFEQSHSRNLEVMRSILTSAAQDMIGMSR
jgi:uncharacterized protein (TIGR04255 family)